MSREFRATTKNHTGNADLVYNRKALQVQEKRLFTLLSIIVTDSVTSNKFKDQLYLSWMPRPFESVLGQVVDTGDFDLTTTGAAPI
jgi:hypothetical protein